jgi:putative transposase
MHTKTSGNSQNLTHTILDLLGSGFAKAFSNAFEDYVKRICASSFGEANVITENEERQLGWQGKTNDLTILVGDIALLIECKNSGLFALAKRSANPNDIAVDARKNLVNSKHRQGLYQLYDKIASIRANLLPAPLTQRYAAVKNFYPVLLLYDEINFANRPECLKNIIDAELRTTGIQSFDYQIWHVEELEKLLKIVPANELPVLLDEKFRNDRFQTLDLSVYLSIKQGTHQSGLHLMLPKGETKALHLMRSLAEQDKGRIRVYGYVVMPEHVHLLLNEPERETLAEAMKSLKQGVSRRLIGDAEHFWQKRYYDHNVRSHAKFVEKLRYIHRNPVKRGLCQRPEDWQWSSFLHYATGIEGAVEIESEWTARKRERAEAKLCAPIELPHSSQNRA